MYYIQIQIQILLLHDHGVQACHGRFSQKKSDFPGKKDRRNEKKE